MGRRAPAFRTRRRAEAGPQGSPRSRARAEDQKRAPKARHEVAINFLPHVVLRGLMPHGLIAPERYSAATLQSLATLASRMIAAYTFAIRDPSQARSGTGSGLFSFA